MQCNIRYDIPGNIAHFERKVVAGEREVCWAGRVLKKEPELLEIEIDRGDAEVFQARQGMELMRKTSHWESEVQVSPPLGMVPENIEKCRSQTFDVAVVLAWFRLIDEESGSQTCKARSSRPIND